MHCSLLFLRLSSSKKIQKFMCLGVIVAWAVCTQLTQLFILPYELLNKWVPWESKPSYPRCYNCLVSRGNGFLLTTGSRVSEVEVRTKAMCCLEYALNFISKHPVGSEYGIHCLHVLAGQLFLFYFLGGACSVGRLS